MIHAPSLGRRAGVLVVIGLLVCLAACSDDEDDGAKSATTSCNDLCTSAGFTGSRVDDHPHETNCFCSGGAGTITPAACTNMCTSIGKAEAEPFGNGSQGPDACQCS